MKEGIEKADVKKWAAKAASLCPRPTSFASCVVETATHTLAYTATQDVAVPLRINKSGQALLLWKLIMLLKKKTSNSAVIGHLHD